MMGWVLTVELSSSAGPSATSFHKSCLRASAASANTSFTARDSAKGRIMPADCDPWPGKTKAKLVMGIAALPADQHGAPREAPADSLQQHVLSGTDASIAHRFVEREGDRRSRGVGMAIHRDHDFFHAQRSEEHTSELQS